MEAGECNGRARGSEKLRFRKKMFIFTSRPRRSNKISNGRENKSLRIRSVYFVGLRKHADTSVERIESESLNYMTLVSINAFQCDMSLLKKDSTQRLPHTNVTCIRKGHGMLLQ